MRPVPVASVIVTTSVAFVDVADNSSARRNSSRRAVSSCGLLRTSVTQIDTTRRSTGSFLILVVDGARRWAALSHHRRARVESSRTNRGIQSGGCRLNCWRHPGQPVVFGAAAVGNPIFLPPIASLCFNPALELYREPALVKRAVGGCSLLTPITAQIDTTLTSSGTYLLLMSDGAPDAAGRYNLNHQRLSRVGRVSVPTPAPPPAGRAPPRIRK